MKNENTVTGYKSLAEDLNEKYSLLSRGELSISTAKEIANIAGKIIKLHVGKLDYNKVVKSNEKIDFWEQ